MRFSIIAAALVAGVSATEYGYGNYTEAPTYTTEVVTEYTTYCPGPTEITHGGITYTATSETTLTITNCPCTITYPVTSSVVTECSTCSTYAPRSRLALPTRPSPSRALVSPPSSVSPSPCKRVSNREWREAVVGDWYDIPDAASWWHDSTAGLTTLLHVSGWSGGLWHA